VAHRMLHAGDRDVTVGRLPGWFDHSETHASALGDIARLEVCAHPFR